MSKATLQQLSIKISSGLTPLRSNEEFWNSPDIPWVKTEQLGQKNIYDSNEKVSRKALDNTGLKLYPKNTLSVAMYGEGKTRGSVSILKKEMTTNQACCNIELDENKADYEYVYYYLTTQYNQLRNLSSGVRKNLNSNDIKNFEIRIPEKLLDQQKIASVLSSLDAKIELNNRINTELETMAKTLYDYWFVQFDFPNKDGKPYKSSGGKMVYNKELKREIPEGWRKVSLGDIGKVSMCKRIHKHETFADEEIPFYKISTFGKEADVFISRKLFYEYKTKYSYPKKGEVLISAAGTIGRIVIFDGVDSFFQDSNIVWIDNDESYASNAFLYLLYQTEPWVTTTGSTIKRLYNADLRNISFAYPSKELVTQNENSVSKRFSSIVNPLIMKTIKYQKENQQLASLRDWLLPMLMNGQVTVKEAEEMAENLNVAAEPGVEYKSKRY